MSTPKGANLKDERIRGLAAKGLDVPRIARKMGMDTEPGRARVREGLERIEAEILERTDAEALARLHDCLTGCPACKEEDA